LTLSAAELAAMRSAVSTLLPDTCIISASTFVSDGAGGGTAVWAAVSGGTVSCRVDPLGALEMDALVTKRPTLKVADQLTVPYDAPVNEDYRVSIGSDNYTVLQLDSDHSWNVSIRARIGRLE
jgi:hypothetical protein